MHKADARSVKNQWDTLLTGARLALEQQWQGLAAGALPCGSAILGPDGNVISTGRNHAYDPAGEIGTRAQAPLQHNRLAHAELNAIALIPTETDHASLTLWTTQHPCSMCAAAIRFVGIGRVHFVADDLSDYSTPEAITATRGDVQYEALGDPLWWTISNLLFLYNPAVQRGPETGNIRMNRQRYPELIQLVLDLARRDESGELARSGRPLPSALERYIDSISKVANGISRQTP